MTDFLKIKTGLAALLAVVLVAGCTNDKLAHRTTQATLWVQNAAEFNALYLQAYQTAETYLKQAVETKAWSAAVEQEGEDVSALPPAIVLDIDETVLDNSPFQARMIEQKSDYVPEEWDKWVQEATAKALAGAVSLTQKADSMGIKVFYITNRDDKAMDATRKNLIETGFPVAEEPEVILLVGGQENWTSSKVERRKMVAESYRIIMLFGDDLNDFISAKNISQAQRDDIVTRYADYWGKKWFILPNPIYGSWEQALTNFDNTLSVQEKQRMIESRLRVN